MKKIMTIIAVAAIATLSSTAMAKDIKKVCVTTQPEMHCSGCENRIKNFFKFEKGIKKIETSVPDQRVVITYDADKTSEQTIIDSFGKINFNAEKVADKSDADSKK